MEKILKIFLKYIFLFLFGGFVYVGIEILFRGYSHFSMILLGGLCFVICGLENEIFSWETPIELQMIISSIIITILELLTGLIVNVYMGLKVWDYSNMPLNFMGQICLIFSIAWLFLSLIAIVIDDYLRYFVFGEEKPRYYSWIVEKIKNKKK